MNVRILVVAPSPKTRGGITSVVKAHQSTYIWSKWNCKWISTYVDRSSFLKIAYAICGYMNFLFFLPFSNIIHIHFSEKTSAFRKNIFLNTSKLFKKKVILHFHSFSPETTINGKKKDLYRKMFEKIDKIVVLSKYWEDQLLLSFPNLSNKINILYNPCPRITINKEIKKENFILYAGTLNERKGYADLIRAFSQIAFKNRDWKLVFAGNGEIENAKSLSNELKISDQVVFLGWVSGEKKDEIFNSSSIFCLPSYNEGFPMAVLDAWAYGLPVITTPVGGLPDILEHNKNALVFESGDINKLAQNLDNLINNELLRETLSNASKDISMNIFNIENIASDLDKIYLTIYNE
ncbi:MAG TPA: glycosyltransferase family 4 protein [Bacteroidales bacterium]|nr:glycosyltransferase family 4 protein [Bacteroidales bacterium]